MVKYVFDFAQDTNDNLWFATNQGLVLKNKSNVYENFYTDKNINGENNNMPDLELDTKNNIWVASRNGLYYFDTSSRTFKGYKHSLENSNSISSDTVYANIEDQNTSQIKIQNFPINKGVNTFYLTPTFDGVAVEFLLFYNGCSNGYVCCDFVW